jgi:F420-0:gamma-glutamyl ligase
MIIRSIKTEIITPGSIDLINLIDKSIKNLRSGCVVAVTSKIVSLCENNVVPFDKIDKEQLIIQESNLYLPMALSKYSHNFTITNNTLIPVAGIDESNGNGNYVLWPKNAQKDANRIRIYLKNKFGLAEVGVIITDSTCHPLRSGTSGIVLAHSGFLALNNYVGKPDLFGRPFSVSQVDIANGLATTAVLQMGEGTERTPIVILSDMPFVKFQNHNPSAKELNNIKVSIKDDLFAPFLTSVKWKKGYRK